MTLPSIVHSFIKSKFSCWNGTIDKKKNQPLAATYSVMFKWKLASTDFDRTFFDPMTKMHFFDLLFWENPVLSRLNTLSGNNFILTTWFNNSLKKSQPIYCCLSRTLLMIWDNHNVGNGWKFINWSSHLQPWNHVNLVAPYTKLQI